jgi:predicted ATPase/class 3 adenylate cyclase
MPDHSRGTPRSGTVTFLFTDIEGSTRLLQDVGNAYPEILALHNRLIRAAVETSGGVEVKTEGDAFFIAFRSAADGVRAAVMAQHALAAASWPVGVRVRVRMGVHTGEASRAGTEYVGLDVHRAARIAAAAHGGQVLLSESTSQLAAGALPGGVRLADKGEHRLKDLDRPEHLYELVIDDLPADFPPIRSVSMRFAILPPQLTGFIGRESEVERIRGLIDGTRFLTLTGPGGTGKTRLAIQAAQVMADAFPDGVAFVPLAPIADPQLVSGTIRETLGLPEEPGRSSLDTITDRIRGSRMLLILDNFEQVLAATGIVASLLERTRELTILVTSRSPLRHEGEQEFPVPPLRLPIARDAGDLEVLRRSEAVSLFTQRATTARPDFVLDRSNAIPISEICARLDGLPLAIELAAARIGLLPPEAMLSRLERRLDLLQSRSTDRPDRQRTLRGAIDWSYDLLDEEEQVAFRRLAVFVGGWDLEDAEAVAPPDVGDQLELLGRLVDHSLIVQEARAGEPRFGMLETIREYGLDRLTRTGELDAIGRAHARRFRELSIELAPGFTASVDALDRAAGQHDNFRAALRWSIDHGEFERAMEAVGAMWRFWHLRGHLREGERWAREVLENAPTGATHGRVRALNALGGLAYWLGDYASSGSAYEAMLDAARSIGDRASEAEANYSLGYIRGIEHDNEGARAAYRESGRVAGLIGDRLGEANAMGGVALIDLLDGRYLEARDGMAQALPVFKAAGDRWLYLNAQGIMGRVLQHLGEHGEARTAALEQLDGSIELGDGTLTALALRILASVAAQVGDFERALSLEGASRSVVERLGGEAPSALIPEVRADELAAQAGVSRDAVDRWLAQGRELTESEAVALAHRLTPGQSA